MLTFFFKESLKIKETTFVFFLTTEKKDDIKEKKENIIKKYFLKMQFQLKDTKFKQKKKTFRVF